MNDSHDMNGDRQTEHEMPKRRPWGPASYWRSGVVLLALVIAGLLAMRLMDGAG
jgi:hypothetical protein